MCHLHFLGQDVNSYMVMKAQAKSMKPTLLTIFGGRAGHLQFTSAKKSLDEGEDMNYVISNIISQIINK